MAAKPNEPLNIVVIGASFAGLSIAHHFLDTTLAGLRKTSVTPDYRLIVISPSTHIYWNIGAPRALVAPNLIKQADAFVPIEPGFRRHKDANIVFIQGSAIGWDTEARTVKVEVIGPRAQKRASQITNPRLLTTASSRPSKPVSTSGVQALYHIPYHALILASGTSAHSDLLSLHGPHTKTISALNQFHARVRDASSIVVCGGGASGVETAGQLATYLNHRSKLSRVLPRRQQRNLDSPAHKRITLIMASSHALPELPSHIGLKAEKMLRGLGVRIIADSRVVEYQDNWGEQGKTKITTSDDKTMLADAYVKCTGVSPNTSFAPSTLLDEHGYIVTNAETLRVDGAGERVYAIGDCASYSLNYVLDVYQAVPALTANLGKDLWAWELRKANPYGGSEKEIEEVEDVIFEHRTKVDSQLCPITRRGGVGILYGYTLPSIMVHLAKGRDYRVGEGDKVVIDGNNPY